MSTKPPSNPLLPISLPRWLLVLALVACTIPSFAQQAYDPDTVLLGVRDRLLPELERLPRYTCVQTITRRYYFPEAQVLRPSCADRIAAYENRKQEPAARSWDRLRLEVAIADGQNVFSWVGAPRFEENTLEKLAGGGPLGSGDFGPFLHSIMRVATVSFQRQQVVDGKQLLLYSYQVPLTRSKYEIKTDQGWVRTGYAGTFMLDPQASDIVSVSVRTEALPDNKTVCQATSEVNYGRIPIHDRAILIPRETRLHMIDPTGRETLSTTSYSNCREYASKSRLFLDAPQEGPVNTAAPSLASAAPLPADLRFFARIVTPVDSATAAAGDPLEAVLRKPIRNGNTTLAPAGARLHARLTRVEQRVGGNTVIFFRFESIELNGATVPLRARADLAPVSFTRIPGSMLVSWEQSSLETTVLVFRGEHLHFKEFEWGWTTLSLDPKKDEPF
jgi:hypothetical protein